MAELSKIKEKKETGASPNDPLGMRKAVAQSKPGPEGITIALAIVGGEERKKKQKKEGDGENRSKELRKNTAEKPLLIGGCLNLDLIPLNSHSC